MTTLDIQINSPLALRETPNAVGIDLDPAKLEFGKTFAPDWFVSEYRNGSWQNARVEPSHNISLHPAALVLHYGQSIFEGMKAYRWANDSVNIFRAGDHARRFNRSATRMAMPNIDEQLFVDGIKMLTAELRAWVPERPGSLYIRPCMIATESCIGVRAANEFLFFVIAMPSGTYF